MAPLRRRGHCSGEESTLPLREDDEVRQPGERETVTDAFESRLLHCPNFVNKPPHSLVERCRVFSQSPNLELRSRTLPPVSAMPEETTTQGSSQTQATVCPGVLPQRHPPIFSGTDDQDVEDWLASYQRVSAVNKWDDVTRLTNVIFYLTGVASLWFRNHEAEIINWASFKTTFSEIFGRPAVRKLRAEQRLRERAQQPGENFTSYIEDVVDLCKRINPSMHESDKIKQILKGIDDDAFQMLLAKDPQTVADVVSLCQSFDELRKQRAQTRRPLEQNDSIAALTLGDQNALFIQIKQFVREEVARQLSILSSTPEPAQAQHLAPVIRQVIQGEVTDALPFARPPPPEPAPLSYAQVVAAGLPRQPTYSGSAPVRPPPVPFSRPVPTNPWRTADNRPICYSCGYAGHVARFCRRRPPVPIDGMRPSAYDHGRFDGTARIQQSSSPERMPSATRRSPSPRRRSLSPMRRRPCPSDAEN